ncbi:MAG: MarR family transcriptional regulator, partial [Coriobacteriales bacterium]
MASRTDDLADLIHRAERLFRGALAAALEETGLTASQAQVISAFARSEQSGLTHKQIAEEIAADIATTSGLLDRLTKAGWLTATPHPEDARSRLYFLTDKS